MLSCLSYARAGAEIPKEILFFIGAVLSSESGERPKLKLNILTRPRSTQTRGGRTDGRTRAAAASESETFSPSHCILRPHSVPTSPPAAHSLHGLHLYFLQRASGRPSNSELSKACLSLSLSLSLSRHVATAAPGKPAEQTRSSKLSEAVVIFAIALIHIRRPSLARGSRCGRPKTPFPI